MDANTVTAVQMIVRSLPFIVFGYPIIKAALKNEKDKGKIILKSEKINAFGLLKLGIVCIAAVYISGYLSILAGWMLSFINAAPGVSVPSPFVPAPMFITFILYVILLPLIEELVFRDVILKCMGRFGVEAAVFSTAFLYAMYSGTLDKLLPAFVTGIVFAYIAITTGSVKNSVILHSAINLTSYILIPQLAVRLGKIGAVALAVFIILIVVAGILLFFFDFKKKLFVKRNDREMIETGNAMECFWSNAGIILYVIYSLLVIFSI